MTQQNPVDTRSQADPKGFLSRPNFMTPLAETSINKMFNAVTLCLKDGCREMKKIKNTNFREKFHLTGS